MKIGIYAKDFVEWAGGLDLLQLLAKGIMHTSNTTSHTPDLLIPSNQCRTHERPDFAFSGRDLLDFFNGQLPELTVIFYETEDPTSVIAEQGLDVLIPMHTAPAEELGVPWVGYVYDFQHRYIPEHYTHDERCRRDRLFADILSHTKSVIVNSESVRDDVFRFFPETSAAVYSLPFCPQHSDAALPSFNNVSKKYNLPNRYFCMCNQFWKHKNHSTAFRAFADFRHMLQDSHVHLICTGRMLDRRFIPPDYIASLRTDLSRLGIDSVTHLLGHIPKPDQLSILKHAEALIQPTLFEGGPGGGSVYDAVSMGVPCIVSDIPVNREIRSDNVTYFPPHSSDGLAQRMYLLIEDPPKRPPHTELHRLQAKRLGALSKCITRAIRTAVQ